MRAPATALNPLTCYRKRKFHRRQAAQNYIAKLRRKKTLGLDTLTAFRCQVCKGWHVGNRKAETYEGRSVRAMRQAKSRPSPRAG